MSEDKPSPLQDALKGVGLLFRAAKKAAVRLPARLPTKGLEETLMTSAREVGRAIENVATRIDKEVFGQAVFGNKDTRKKDTAGTPHAAPSSHGDSNDAPPKPRETKPPDAA